MKKLIKRMAILGVIFASVGLCGCVYSESLKSYWSTDLKAQISSRFDSNQSALDTLHNSGLVSDELYQKLSDSLTSNQEMFNESLDSVDLDTAKRLAYAMSGIKIIKEGSDSQMQYLYDDDGNKVLRGTEEFDKLVDSSALSNVIYNGVGSSDKAYKESFSEGTGDSNGFSVREVSSDEALPIIDDDTLSNELNDKLNCELYVLNSNLSVGTDEVVEYIASCVSDGGTVESTSLMSKYFVDSGEKLFANSDGISIFTVSEDNFYSSDNEPGKDLVISQNGTDIVSLKLKELNVSAINELQQKIGLNTGKYIFDVENNRCYLMEYPVDTVSSLNYKNDSQVYATTTRSDLAINLYTQEILKYDYDSSTDTTLPTASVIGSGIEDYQSYLSLSGADDSSDKPQSSFVIAGEQEVEIEYNISSDGGYSGKRSVSTARVVLRDYLEATYAPDYISDSSSEIVVLGRKYRLNFSSYSADGSITLPIDGIAKLVDTNGEEILDSNGGTIEISADNIMDLSKSDGIISKESRGTDNYRIFRVMKSGETDGQEIQSSKVGSDTPVVGDLGVTAVSSINPILRFPSTELDENDYVDETESQPIMYAIGTSSDMFETKLYDSWVSSDSSTASLTWWNKWLNNVGYSYNVNLTSLNNYLSNNYSYDMSQEGVVILDLETIAKIQTEFDERDNIQRSNKFRTFFKVLGWAIIIWAIIMIPCWTIDTQLGIGISLYGIVTFGKCKAVKYKSDVEGASEQRVKYVGMSGMAIRCICLIFLGLVMIQVNIFSVLIYIVKQFGKFASTLVDYFNL